MNKLEYLQDIETVPGLSREQWIEHVEKFMEDEGMYTLYEAESLMLYLIREGRLERPTRCL